MRELTFAGFLRRYVKELSFSGSTNVSKLFEEAQTKNPRLYEPLFLYCHCFDKKELLGKESTSPSISEGLELFARYPTWEQLTRAFQSMAEDIPANYHKVWRSYQTARNRISADDHTKELMRSYILELQEQHHVSTYRIYRDLNLNPGNFNAWLKHGTPCKISLDNARRVVAYLENTEH